MVQYRVWELGQEPPTQNEVQQVLQQWTEEDLSLGAHLGKGKAEGVLSAFGRGGEILFLG